MIYHLLYPLHTVLSSFNVFRYITFRTIYATVTALVIAFLLGPWLIRKLQEMKIGQPIRDDGPNTHFTKEGTPTMGGLLIIFSAVAATFLWANLTQVYIWLALFVTITYGLIGFADDYRKLVSQSAHGIPGWWRLVAEAGVALFVALVLYRKPGFASTITLPFFKTVLIDLGIAYILFVVFIIVGAANAVNLTDGLDGLAIGPVTICFMTYLLFSYFRGT